MPTISAGLEVYRSNAGISCSTFSISDPLDQPQCLGAVTQVVSHRMQRVIDGNGIALKYAWKWPAHSPDLNPLDF